MFSSLRPVYSRISTLVLARLSICSSKRGRCVALGMALAAIVCSAGNPAIAQSGMWTWTGGSSTVPGSNEGQPGVYGTLGAPSAANIPGGRGASAVWTDKSGNFWLFGGYGLDASGSVSYLDDLWELNQSTHKWTWISGSSTVGTTCVDTSGVSYCGQPGVYGTLGTAAAGNVPGGRADPSSWIDGSGNLWLFGGYGFDANENLSTLDDVWEFNPTSNQWTWMGGSNTIGSNFGQPGVYGTLGTPAAGNIPGSRYFSTGWTDSSGQFWLFGGYGFDGNGVIGYLNDLWEFNPSTNAWTWMGGSNTIATDGNGQSGVYGTLRTPAAANIPGARAYATTWFDSNGNVWLFGGGGFDENGNFGYLNDLWEFSATLGKWAWMGGSSTVVNKSGQPGVYGPLGTPATGNTPGGRESAIGWIGSGNKLWLFGGVGYDANDTFGSLGDLWEFSPSTNEWTWVGGNSTPGSAGQPGAYGTLGAPATADLPGGRYYAANWADSGGNFWLFGGLGQDAGNTGGFLNDLWEFRSAAAMTSPTPGSVLPGSSTTFSWTAGSGVASYQLFLGTTGVGSSNLYNSGHTTVLSASVSGLPTYGQTIYVRLYSEIGGVWQSSDYTYTEAGSPVPSALISPAPVSTLSGSSVTFTWTAGQGVTSYQLFLGTQGVGSSNVYSTGHTTALSASVTGLPTYGQAFYARLYSEIKGVWSSVDYTFTEAGSPLLAVLSTPAPSSVLPGSSVTFTWTTGGGVKAYQLELGTLGVGSSNLYNSGHIAALSASVTGLPAYGQTIFARLYSDADTGIWQSVDFTYTQAGAPVLAALSTPAPAIVLSGSSATFTWTAGGGIESYQLYLGTTGAGSSNLYNSGHTTALSANVTGIPAYGQTVYARLFSDAAGTWESVDYTYAESGSPIPAVLTTPTPGSTLSGSSATFTWTAGGGVSLYQLFLGTTGVGSSNLYTSGHSAATSASVTNLPTTGAKIYARLYSDIGGTWSSIDYTYTAQ